MNFPSRPILSLRVAALLALLAASAAQAQSPARATRHTFALADSAFLLDGRPFQIRAGELHPSRIPKEYWRHRIQMAKAMGLNTIAAYVFWNHHEEREGEFDFTNGSRDIARFIEIAQEEGMWVLLRPGPYVCAEWDFGGLPPYLLRDPQLRIRTLYAPYMAAAERYMAKLADEVRPLLVTRGGPILMVQVENEYGSYGNDRAYMSRLRDTWVRLGVDVPFFTGDGPTTYMLGAGTLPGAAIGLDSGSDESHWTLARSINPGVPIFSSETYPGWLTHWGEAWAAPSVDDLRKEVDFLLANRKSFNFYVVHGGTNFGFTAGANSGGKGYEPDLTSYDYDAPIDEQGRPTAKYHMLRAQLGASLPPGESLAPIPAPIPAIAIPAFEMRPFASLWTNLPTPRREVAPRPFEYFGQNQGLALYRTTLVGRTSGRLVVTELHDFATVFVDGVMIGTIDRRLGETGLDLPATVRANPVLEILVEGMGHINFAQAMIDRKGITDRVTLSGMTLFNWEVSLVPLDDAWVTSLRSDASRRVAAASEPIRPGHFFRGEFTLEKPADTFIDMTGYRKGVVWLNGHNLGRFWEIGPQFRLYAPASFLKAGRNEVVVLDLLKTEATPLRGAATLKEEPSGPPRKAVFILLDGIPADVMERVPTPILDEIAAAGGYTRAHVGGEIGGATETPTVSAPGYMSLLTGTWANKHNVRGNSNQTPNYDYWNIFRAVETMQPQRRTALFSTWTDNRTVLIGLGRPRAGDFRIDHVVDGFELDTIAFPHDRQSEYIRAIDDRVASEAAAHIAAVGPDLSWVYLQHTDDAGHANGDSPRLHDAVQQADARIGRIWEAVKRRQALGEDWMIVITTDHGRDAVTGRGHGGQSARERTTWIVTNQPGLSERFTRGMPAIVDIAPSILQHLGVVVPEGVGKGMDGVSFLRARR